MHISLGLIGLLTTIGVVLYRINMARQGAEDLLDIAGEAANLPRKLKFRSKTRKKGLAIVTDPREAATILMLGVAQVAGEVTDEHKAEIRKQVEKGFDLGPEDSEELLSRAIWILSDLNDPGNAINPMMDLISQNVGTDEMQDFMRMMKVIIAIDGELKPPQRTFMTRCRGRAGLR
jgi:uncharacterized tellurite resistance protein B-like protein